MNVRKMPKKILMVNGYGNLYMQCRVKLYLNKNNRNVEPGARIKNWFTPGGTGLYWLQSRGIDLYVFLGR